MTSRAAQRDRLGHRVRAFGLLKHGRVASSSSAHDVVGLGRGGDVVLGDRAGELGADRVRDRLERDQAGQRGEAAEQHGVGQRPAEVLERDLGGRHACSRRSWRKRCAISARPSSSKLRLLLMQHVAVGLAGPGTRRPGAAASGPGRSARRARGSARAGGSRWSSMRQNATTGAPVRSEPKLGNACAWRPCSKAAIENISAAVTTPWPPRPCIRICNMRRPSPRCRQTYCGYVGSYMHERTCASRSAGRSMPAWPWLNATSATATASFVDTSRTCESGGKRLP